MSGEDPSIVRMNIAHFEALLTGDIDDNRRRAVIGLLAETKESLQQLTNWKSARGDVQRTAEVPARRLATAP